MENHVTFAAGELQLEGLLSLPESASATGVVVCHPHPLRGGEMRNTVVEALVKAFAGAGYATLRFNFRGVGGSTGQHDDGKGEQDDVRAAVTYLLSRHAFSTVAVAGYSFGSLVGLKAGGEDPRVAKLIGVALPIATRDASFLHGVNKPKLLISGDSDDFSPESRLRDLMEATAEPKSLVIIPGADHFFGGRAAAVGKAAAEFLQS